MPAVAELVGLEVRVSLAGNNKGVEVAAGDELAGLAEGQVQEAEVEADVVADNRRAGDEGQELFGRFAGDGCAGDVCIGDAVHLRAEDLAARVDKR
jgi:hypothetical protein